MKRIKNVKQNDTVGNLAVTYCYTVINGSVDRVEVEIRIVGYGFNVNIIRTYWRDMTFAPVATSTYLSDEHNQAVADAVAEIFNTYTPEEKNED